MLRFLRFNLVGLLGTALQLAVLKLLTTTTHIHYLVASTIALELTLLHNFAWHERYTWRDRGTTHRAKRLLRFHATNGLLSLASNLALLPLLHRHMPLLLANLIAITATGTINFLLTHHWTFAAPNPRVSNPGYHRAPTLTR